MLDELIEQRNLPEINFEPGENFNKTRKYLLNTLLEEEYGVLPKKHDKVTFETISEDKKFCAGKATLKKIMINSHFGDKVFSFPAYSCIPCTNKKLPFFVHINFRPDVPDKYMPSEEICDRGYAVISFCYRDVTEDYNERANTKKEYGDGVKDFFFDDENSKKSNSAGSIAMWAWAASRVMDYAMTLDNLDFSKCAVIGHSRLGKTALLAGALDERFQFVISNDSGCCGAAITSGKKGETMKDIHKHTYWFCDNCKKYAEEKMPFDQHFLLSLIAPRKLYVASAENDLWADPESEFLCSVYASKAYEALGIKGLVCPDRLPKVNEHFHDGNIAYHIRPGNHYLSREDWNLFMDYIDKF